MSIFLNDLLFFTRVAVNERGNVVGKDSLLAERDFDNFLHIQRPYGAVVDGKEDILVAYCDNHCIQKFTTESNHHSR